MSGNTKIVRKRYTKKQIQERRLAVWEMLNCGFPLDEIAQKCQVSERTIQRDQQWWMERLGYDTQQLKDPKHAAQDVGMTAARLMQLSTDAYVQSLTVQNHSYKQRYMETSGRMLALRHKLLADAGYLPKVGHEQEEQMAVKLSFEARFGKDAPQAIFDDDKSRRKVLEAVFASLDLGIESLQGAMPALPPGAEAGEGADDVIDVEGTVVDVDGDGGGAE